jgi:hypothetical protein
MLAPDTPGPDGGASGTIGPAMDDLWHFTGTLGHDILMA